MPREPLGFHKAQRRRIDAVAKARRFGAVVENETQVGIAFLAQHFDSAHPEGIVGLRGNVLLRRGSPEARPDGSRIEFLRGPEQRSSAADTAVKPGFVI